ncbi:PT domain-containing protein [Lachnoclostridium phytofermentans]|uniref:PT repeat-containing protein n=1 Tax=Lachnoclostridium phytofermentans (strain ATCC 700394 / DSM 18823 / ISDg) TaxID=357809 RepID=A9KT49_LACP7|nr:PT domain-containing protein [Lachnoclostridium phytofermentans]ABX42260.1 PT repeat-containing protein [Lachnoclostridium phytofermentans ISDg]
MDYNINGSEVNLSEIEDDKNKWEDQIRKREDQIGNREDQISKWDDHINKRDDQISKRDDHINKRDEHTNKREDQISKWDEHINKREDHTDKREHQISKSEDHLNKWEDYINNMNKTYEENKEGLKMQWMEGFNTKEMEAKNSWNEPVNQPINQPKKQPINQPMNQPINQPMNQPIKQPVNQYDYIATSNMISFMREGAGAVILSNPENSNTKIFIEKTIYHNFSDAILSLEVFHNVETPEDAMSSDHYAPKDLSNYPQEPFGKVLSHENLAYHKDYCFLSSTINPYQSVDESMLKGMVLTPGTNLAYVFHIVNQQPQTVISVTFHWTEIT